MKRNLLYIFILIGMSIQAQQLPSGDLDEARNIHKVQEKLKTIYSNWIQCTTEHFCQEGEKLDKDFASKLTYLVLVNPETFKFPFESLVKNDMVKILDSEDGKLRIYNWDKFSNTSMREFYSIYQFQSGKEIQTELGKSDKLTNLPFADQVQALFTFQEKGKTYYFTIRNTILSANEIIQTIECLTLENGKLVRNHPIFKTKTKTLGKISFEFYRASLYNTLDDVDNLRDAYQLIEFDSKQKKICIPVVNKEGEVQESFLVYQWTGNYFEYQGIQK